MVGNEIGLVNADLHSLNQFETDVFSYLTTGMLARLCPGILHAMADQLRFSYRTSCSVVINDKCIPKLNVFNIATLTSDYK